MDKIKTRMKHYIYYLMICILQLPVAAKAATYAVPQKDGKGKWGLVDNTGNYIVKPQFSEMEDLGNGKFAVAVGGKLKDGVLVGEKWGVINYDGSVILNANYDEIGDFINGIATITKGEKIGFVNSEWKVIAEPKYDFAGTANAQGFVWVNSGGKPDKRHIGFISKGKYGIINTSGDIIVPVSFNSIGYISETKFYYDQLKIHQAKSEMERLMLECGSQYALWAKPIDLKAGSMIPESIGFAFSNKHNLILNGITDVKGKILIKNNIYQHCTMPCEGLALVSTKKNQVGFHDITTIKLITNNSIRSAFSFNGNMMVGIDSKNKWNFYDKSLSPIGDGYDWISPRIGQYYLVRKDNEMKMIDAENLNTIVSDKEYIFPPINGLMAYKDVDNGLWGYLYENGNVAIAPQYKYAYSFNHGVGCVKGEHGWGMINPELKEVIAPKWDNIRFPTTDMFDKVWVADNSLATPYHCLNISTDNYAFKSSFNEAWNFNFIGNSEYAAVKIGDNFGQIDSEGNIVVPIEFKSKSIADNALSYKIQRGIKQWKPIHTYRFNTLQNNKCKDFTIKDTLPDDNWDY